MRKVLFIIFSFFFTLSFLPAQQRTGNIYGKVIDESGSPLPGVKVTLSGSLISSMTSITSIEGNFKFISLSPAKDYVLFAELEGFMTKKVEGCIVTVGISTSITITLEIGTIEEEITVTAQNPVIDAKKTTIGQTFTQEDLQSMPTARDPWVLLQMAPALQVDRENVGGSESGQQSNFIGRGLSSVDNNIWTMDGTEISAPASGGGTAIYYDFDSFEEVNITVGGNDVTVQTAGIGINIVTRRGGNKLNLEGRYYMTDEKLQANNLTEDLKKEGIIGTNRIVYIRDYGFNFSLPIVKNKSWLWMAYGVQDIKTLIITGTRDDTLLANYTAKFNLQIIPQNRLEIFGSVAGKDKWGRDASYTFPKGWRQSNKYHFGFPLLKIQDEHMFGNDLFISAKFSYLDSGFTLKPMENEDLSKIGKYNITSGIWEETYYTSQNTNLRNQFNFLANYFRENLFGANHEIKIGFDYVWRKTASLSQRLAYYRVNYNIPTVDITGDKVPDIVPSIAQVNFERYAKNDEGTLAIAAYFSDTITIRNFNVVLGLRYDKQSPKILGIPVLNSIEKDSPSWKNNFSEPTADAISSIFAGFEIPKIIPDYSWKVFSPRLGITWDIHGNGKTLAKLSLGQYGDFMDASDGARYFRPLGTGGWMNFWWLDNNKDKKTDFSELYWHNSITYSPYRVFNDAGSFIGDWENSKNIMWGGFDPYNPLQTQAPNYTVDNSAGSSRTREALLTLEREIIPNFGASIGVSYRKYDRMNWDLGYFPTTGKIESQSDYVQVGNVPNEVGLYSTDEGANRPYYLLSGDYGATSFLYRTRRPDYSLSFYGMDFMVNKRLSNKWMMNGSFSLQAQKSHYGEKGYLNPTQIWALENMPYAAYGGVAGGKISQYVFSRWLFKISALYQFPLDINVSVTLNAREGNIIEETVTINDINAPNPTSRSIKASLDKFGELRLPASWCANLRIERIFRAGDYAKIYLMADVFNLFNQATMNRRYQRNLGTYYVHNGLFVEDPTNFRANEILNPRVIRFGLRFAF